MKWDHNISFHNCFHKLLENNSNQMYWHVFPTCSPPPCRERDGWVCSLCCVPSPVLQRGVRLLLNGVFGFSWYTVKRKETNRRDGLGLGREFYQWRFEGYLGKERLEASKWLGKTREISRSTATDYMSSLPCFTIWIENWSYHVILNSFLVDCPFVWQNH